MMPSNTTCAAKAQAEKADQIVERLSAADRRADRAKPPKRPQSTSRHKLFLTLRLNDLEAVYRHRHGKVYPDTPDGRKAIDVIAGYTAMRSDAPVKSFVAFARARVPWLVPEDATRIVEGVIDTPLCEPHRKRELGRIIGLTEAERSMLGIRTIEAIDVTPRQRKAINRERDAARKRAARRRAGATSHGESLARKEPWKAAGVSRRTWFRRRGTDSSGITCLNSDGRISAKGRASGNALCRGIGGRAPSAQRARCARTA
jgi:hypothetical protein